MPIVTRRTANRWCSHRRDFAASSQHSTAASFILYIYCLPSRSNCVQQDVRKNQLRKDGAKIASASLCETSRKEGRILSASPDVRVRRIERTRLWETPPPQLSVQALLNNSAVFEACVGVFHKSGSVHAPH